jgi:glycosyltransferase involved in cell wall biosynthesis
MLSNKSVLFLTHNYSSFQKDQIEELAKYFKKVYVLVRYKPIAEIAGWLNIAGAKNHTKNYAIDLRDKPKNITVIPVPLWYLPFNWFYKRLGDWHFHAVDKIIQNQKIKFDLIHAHFTWTAGYVGAKLKEKYNKRLVITGHGYDVYKLPFKNNFWREKIKNVLNSADNIITVSESNLQFLQKLKIKTPISIIANGFNHKLFFPKDRIESRKKINLPLDKKIVLAVGSLDIVKGHRYLIEALKTVKKTCPNILCLIIGDGPLKNHLKNQIKDIHLTKNIKLIDYVAHDKLNDWYNASDLFVLPSISESFGVVQLEALACGKPVVATINGGSEEIITSQEYGLLCKNKNPKDLADKILLALAMKWDKKKIMSYMKYYSWPEIVRKLLLIYNL